MIELGRDVVNLPMANSSEFAAQCEHPVIDLMFSQRDVQNKGGTMRLGAYPCNLQEGSLAASSYGELVISERHRHRYEVNNQYREQYEESGVVFSGLSPDGNLVEILEYPVHPFFIAVQFHPELKSRPTNPHPLFTSFVAAAVEHSKK